MFLLVKLVQIPFDSVYVLIDAIQSAYGLFSECLVGFSLVLRLFILLNLFNAVQSAVKILEVFVEYAFISFYPVIV